MSLIIQSWCPGQGCDPCKPVSLPPNGGGSGLPLFTDAYVQIRQLQVVTDTRGNQTSYVLGSMIIYSAADNLPPQGAFGVPSNYGSPAESSVVSWVVLYQSVIQILHPYYPPGSYDASLQDITTGPLSGTDPSNQAASVQAGNAAIAQANQVLGNSA